MTAPTHIIVGVGSAVAFAHITGIEPDRIALLLVMIGALAPDIDGDDAAIARPGTLLNRLLPPGLVRIVDSVCGGICAGVHKTFGHRGLFHWPIVGIAICVSGVALDSEYLFWFGLGYLSHIVADFFTAGGVPLWGPFYRKPIRWSPLKTGSWSEGVVALGLAALVVYWGVDLLPSHTRESFLALVPIR